MGGADRAKQVRVVFAASSFVIIVIGLGFALSGAWFGWLIAAAGVIDLAAGQFVAAWIAARRGRPPSAPGASPGPDPTADPSHNPYARED